ncbi:MAG TPA: aspartate aminotransferase family protein [Frankiaceae bacterium]|jgi:taurine--2-oxoglutarate transaminase|nr:aspartate aminotransferase family protein [Frankiaceae bacterium]
MTSSIYDADREFVFHSWSAQAAIDPMVVAGGEGSWFWDEQGRRYLDFASQLVNLNLGHQHPAIVAAIAEKAGQLCTIAPVFAEESRSRAAAMIAARAPEGLNRVFFTNGGADANEHAVRLARLTTGRPKVLSAYRSYHGATSTAMALTGEPRRWASDAGNAGAVHFFGPYPYRSAFYATSEAEECERALQHLADVITLEGSQTIAAIILETVVGTNGILVPPPGYLAGVRELCDRFGIVFIADEVMCGFARCGEWFAIDHWDVAPDLITFAKGVNSGYIPLGGVVINDPIADAFAHKPYPGGLTYSGHVLACAAAVASMEAFEAEGTMEYVRRTGEEVVRPALEAIAKAHPSVGEVRGLGMFWAIELVRDPQTREPLVPFNASGADAAPMAELASAAKQRGLYPFTHFNRMHVVPPCNTSAEDLRHGLGIIDEVLELADRHVTDQAR